jgi:L-threonylcarbamoyladenylate synthase
MAVRPLKAHPAAIRRAARALRRGRLVAFPTETVYGLGADATADRAVAAIYAAKRRPRRNPLIVHVPDLRAARRLAVFDGRAERLAKRFWPGPLTLVLRRRPGAHLSRLLGRALTTVAIRVPDNPVALALLRRAGRPLAAPSANRSGAVSPTRALHVRQSLGGRVAMVLDGGPCRVGVESTVLDLSGPTARLLRPGGAALEALEQVVAAIDTTPIHMGALDAGAAGEPQRLASPGLLASHYAPHRPVRPNAPAPAPGEAYLAFGAPPADLRAGATLNLSPSGDLAEAAANLFQMLQALDRPEFTAIAVAPIPRHGLGRAINDRLTRAAAPRPFIRPARI